MKYFECLASFFEIFFFFLEYLFREEYEAKLSTYFMLKRNRISKQPAFFKA